MRIKNMLCPGDSFPCLAAIQNLKEVYDGPVEFVARKPIWTNFFAAHCSFLGKSEGKEITLEPTIAGVGKDMTTIYTEELAKLLDIKIPVKHLVPTITLKKAVPAVSKPFALCISGGKLDYTTKHWLASKTKAPYLQEVIDSTPQYQWIQVGNANNEEWQPSLRNVVDMRGQTDDPKKLFELAQSARLIICGCTMLAWVGATLKIPTIVIAGGRELGSGDCPPIPRTPFTHFISTSLECAGSNGCWIEKHSPLHTNIDAWDSKNELCRHPTEVKGIATSSCMASITPAIVLEQISKIERKQIPMTVFCKPRQPDEAILLTGGIGDVITLESHWTDDFKKNLKRIYYASRANGLLIELMKLLYPNAQHRVVWNDFSERFAFYRKSELTNITSELPFDWDDVADWSITERFPKLNNYSGSSLLKSTFAPITPIDEPYIVLVPDSPSDQRQKSRHITPIEWSSIYCYLEQNKLKGVILNTGTTRINHPNIIDLTNKTSIAQSIEYLKKAVGYIGVDSCLSVLAAQLFEPARLFIKSTNDHLDRWKHVYYAPHQSFEFVLTHLTHI